MTYGYKEYYRQKPKELYDDHTKRILAQRPGQCFGCRTMKLCGKTTFFGKVVWACDSCIPIIKKWERDLKESKVRR